MAAPTNYTQYPSYIKKTILSSSPQNKAYLELILSFTAVAFFGWFALRPTFITLVELFTEIEAKQEIVTKLDQKIDALVAADTTYKAAEEQLILLDEALPTDHEAAQMIAQLEVLSQEAGIEISSLNYSTFPLNKATAVRLTRRARLSRENAKSLPWKNIEFDLVGRSSYQQLRQVIFQMHGLRRVVLVDKIDFRREGKSADQILTLKLTGRVLYL